jgi:hypothetical protein
MRQGLPHGEPVPSPGRRDVRASRTANVRSRSSRPSGGQGGRSRTRRLPLETGIGARDVAPARKPGPPHQASPTLGAAAVDGQLRAVARGHSDRKESEEAHAPSAKSGVARPAETDGAAVARGSECSARSSAAHSPTPRHRGAPAAAIQAALLWPGATTSTGADGPGRRAVAERAGLPALRGLVFREPTCPVSGPRGTTAGGIDCPHDTMVVVLLRCWHKVGVCHRTRASGTSRARRPTEPASR